MAWLWNAPRNPPTEEELWEQELEREEERKRSPEDVAQAHAVNDACIDADKDCKRQMGRAFKLPSKTYIRRRVTSRGFKEARIRRVNRISHRVWCFRYVKAYVVAYQERYTDAFNYIKETIWDKVYRERKEYEERLAMKQHDKYPLEPEYSDEYYDDEYSDDEYSDDEYSADEYLD